MLTLGEARWKVDENSLYYFCNSLESLKVSQTKTGVQVWSVAWSSGWHLQYPGVWVKGQGRSSHQQTGGQNSWAKRRSPVPSPLDGAQTESGRRQASSAKGTRWRRKRQINIAICQLINISHFDPLLCSGHRNIPYLRSFSSHNAPIFQETEAQRGSTMHTQSQIEGSGSRSLPKVSLCPEPVLDTEMLRVGWLGGDSQPRLWCLSRGLSLWVPVSCPLSWSREFLSACPPFLLLGLPGRPQVLYLSCRDTWTLLHAQEANGQS